jgi:hypothetical protein
VRGWSGGVSDSRKGTASRAAAEKPPRPWSVKTFVLEAREVGSRKEWSVTSGTGPARPETAKTKGY